MKIVAGSTQPNLAKRIGELLNTDLVQSRVEKFKDGELRVQIIDNLENEDVAIIQSTSNPVNDNLMELLLLIDTAKRAKRAKARQIIAVIPYFGYGRQDQIFDNYGPLPVHLVATLLEKAGATKVITIDLHSPTLENFFKIPIQNVSPISLFIPLINMLENPVIVSPDAGVFCGQKQLVKV